MTDLLQKLDKSLKEDLSSKLQASDTETFQPMPFQPKGVSAAANVIGEQRFLESKGIDIETGAPSKARMIQSFAVDEREKFNALKKNLSEYYGSDVQMRTGPNSGELEFFNPDNKKWSLVNPRGFDVGDLKSISGDALVTVPDMAATLGVSIFTANPVAGISAGSVGAFAGEYARLKIGQLYGINEGLSENSLMVEAMKAAGISAAGGAAGYLLARVSKGIMNMISGRSFNLSATEGLSEKDLFDASETAEKINSVIRENKLRFTSGQAYDDVDLLALEELFRKTRTFGAIQAFRDFDEAQVKALKEFWDWTNSPYLAYKTAGKAEVGRQIQQVAQRQTGAAREFAEASVESAEQQLTKALGDIKTAPHKEVGNLVREGLLNLREDFNQWAKAGAQNLDDIAGGTKFIKPTRTREVLTKLSKKKDNALFKKLTKGDNAVLDTDILKIDEQGEFIIKNVSFDQYWDAVKNLDRNIRVSSKGLSADTPEVGLMKHVKNALEEDATFSLKGSPLAEPFDTYRAAVRTQKDAFDRSIVADILGTDERVFQISREKIIQTFEKSSVEDIELLQEILTHNPQTLQLYREGVADLYLNTVKKDGVISTAKHDKFFKDHGSKLKTLFPESEYKEIEKVGGLQEHVSDLAKKREESFRKISKTTQGQIEDIRPKSLINRFWDKDPDPAELSELKGILKNDTEVWKAFQAEVIKDMDSRLTRRVGNQRSLSFGRLDDYLYGTGTDGSIGRIDALKEVLGDGWVKNVETLHSALKIAHRESIAPNRSGTAPVTSALNHLARIYTGMFTAKGRALTATKAIMKRQADRAMIEAILDPDKLNMMAELASLKPGTKQASIILGKLGATMLADDQITERTVKEENIKSLNERLLKSEGIR